MAFSCNYWKTYTLNSSLLIYIRQSSTTNKSNLNIFGFIHRWLSCVVHKSVLISHKSASHQPDFVNEYFSKVLRRHFWKLLWFFKRDKLICGILFLYYILYSKTPYLLFSETKSLIQSDIQIQLYSGTGFKNIIY